MGFLFAWVLQQMKIEKLKKEAGELSAALNNGQVEVNKLQAELGFQQKSKEQQQKMMQEVENQASGSRQALNVLQVAFDELSEQYRNLEQTHREGPREIEVLREVPVLVFREPKRPMDRRTKAKELVKAFRKGYIQSEKTSTLPPSSS